MRKSQLSGRPRINQNSFVPPRRPKKTKFKILPLGRTILRIDQQISEGTIREVFENNLHAQYATIKLEFLPDCLGLYRKYDHEVLPYSDIQHFYQCAEIPDVFMWYIKDQIEQKNVYENYLCQSPADVKAIRDQLYQATSKSLRIFTDIPGYRRTGYSPASSQAENINDSYDENGLLEVQSAYSDDSSASHSITSIEGWYTPSESGSSRTKRMHRIRYRSPELPPMPSPINVPSSPPRSRQSSSRSRTRGSHVRPVSPIPVERVDNSRIRSKSKERKPKRLPRIKLYAPDG